MHSKIVMAGIVAGALIAAPAEKAQADAGDFIGGAIVGGLVTGAIMHNNQKQKQRTTRSYAPRIAVTQQGRETQTALNYFGFNAGVVDGQVGRGTRAAIERYQASMGFPINGRDFSTYQFNELMEAYYWALNGGQAQTRLVGQPLLQAYRTQHQTLAATATPLPLAPVAPAAPAQGQTLALAPVATPTPEASQTEAGTLPNLFAGGSTTVSLANECNSVMLQTSSNGGYTTLATLSDPGFTLQEQFCIARSYAISQGEQKMAAITGLTQAQITDQCGTLAGSISAQIDAVSLLTQAEAEAGMRSFALGTGIPPADLASTARVCLAVGYRQDDMRMAVGSSLLLSAMGEPAYGELLGHHLIAGFGTSERPDLALQWFDTSLRALESGAQAAFMPGQPERTPLLRAAVIRLAQGNTAQPVPAAAEAATGQTLPTFGISQ